MSENLKFDSDTNVLTVGSVEGVNYFIKGRRVEGEVQLDKTTVVTAKPAPGRTFPKGTVSEFKFEVGETESDPVAQNADPVDADTAGSTPENVAQQSSKADSSAKHSSGFNPRQP